LGIFLASSDNYERFLHDVEEHINNADREIKQKAETALEAIADNYRRLISERIEQELDLIDSSEATGDVASANHHRVLAQVYRSMLDSWQLAQSPKEGL
jgi:hypothetical protein